MCRGRDDVHFLEAARIRRSQLRLQRGDLSLQPFDLGFGGSLHPAFRQDGSHLSNSQRLPLAQEPSENVERGLAGGTVHFIGLLSDGNVHSHIQQLFALLDHCAEDGIQRVRVHVLLDGRDVGERSALTYIDALEARLAALNAAGRDYRIASGGGRMVTTMDRYSADWSVVERGWKAHVLGVGRAFASAREAVETCYREDPGSTDQYLPSFVVAADGKPVGTIEDGDAVVFFNFRGDRAIEISRAFEEQDFHEFDRVRRPDVLYAGMMQYDGDALIPKHFLVEPPAIDCTVSQYLCASGVTSFAVSETQKFGHVTYFWNGNNSGYIDEALEKYVEIESDRVMFDQRPWMKAAEITDVTPAAIGSGRFKFVRLNYANGDMVGHTGVREAAIQAVAAVDLCLGRLLRAVAELQGIALVTADHGNADEMYEWDKKKKAFEVDPATGAPKPKTAHTLNPVPFIDYDPLYAGEYELGAPERPGLGNIAATALNLMGYAAPEGYLPSLVRFKQ